MRLWLTLVLWLGSSLVLTEESPPPSKRHKCPEASASKHLLCYHNNEIPVAALDPCVCTHFVLAAKEAGDGYRLDTEKDGALFASILRERNPSLRLLLGVDAASRALHGAPSQKVSDFARSTADYIKSARLDGLEVDLGDIADDSTHVRRKEGVVSLFKALREELQDDAKDGSLGDTKDSTVLLRLPVRPEALAKAYDLKSLSKYVDYFTVSTHNITDASERDVTYHHSRLMGLADILNTDTVLDLLTGMGAPPTKLIISLPTQALTFRLKDEKQNVARSPVAGIPKAVNYEQVCSMIKEGGWTVERDEDLTAPYAFRNKTWIAFEDETSVTIKGKYALLRGLAGVAVSSIDADDHAGICGRGPFPLTKALQETLTTLSRKPRALILRSLEEELRGGETVTLPEATLGAEVHLSPFRIVRVVDREGAVHVIRRNSETKFQCSRQGYFRHPLGCNQFFRCVKFDQLSHDFSVFEYDCPPGLAFDEKWEVCVWPGQMSRPCDGSSEIAPVPRARFTCPAEGYYADPENCRWFFACLDHHGDPNVATREATDPHSGLTAYEFRCPFGLAFDGSRLACEWPWMVPGCGKVEIGSGVLAAVQPARFGYSLLGASGSIAAGSTLHHSSHSDSGTVASVIGASGVGSGASLVSGTTHIGGISHDLHSLGGENFGSGGGSIASGGTLIGIHDAKLGFGAPTYVSGSHGVSSGAYHANLGSLHVSSDGTPLRSLSGAGFGRTYSYQAPSIRYESASPVEGLSYASRSSIVTGYGGTAKAVQPEAIVGLSGVQGDGYGKGISVSNAGLSGIGYGRVGLDSVPTVAPLGVHLVSERPHQPISQAAYDDVSKHTVSVSTIAPTSRPLSLVKTNLYSSSPSLVTPAPIIYQSPRPTFSPHTIYQNAVPVVSTGNSVPVVNTAPVVSSYSITGSSQVNRNSAPVNTFGLAYSSGSEASDTRSGSVNYAPRPLTSYQPESHVSQTYSSLTGPSFIPSYSLDSSPPQTGGIVPVRPISTTNIVKAPENTENQYESYHTMDAARNAAAASSDGGSVGNAISQESQSFTNGASSNDFKDGIGLGHVRDDGHAVTGDASSRLNLARVVSNYQGPSISVPEVSFSYKNLPISIYGASAPSRDFGVIEKQYSSIFSQPSPQSIFSATNVSPAPSLLNALNDRIHQSTVVTQSTTPVYVNPQVDANDQRSGGEGFSYKRILPVVEFSTPSPPPSQRVTVEEAHLGNNEDSGVKGFGQFFTTTSAPTTSIGLDDQGYGSRIYYAGINEQPVAYTSSRGTSGILNTIQSERPTPVAENPSLRLPTFIKEDHSYSIDSNPAVFVSTTPQPPSTISEISYSSTPAPIINEPSVFLTPSRGPTRQRFYPTTTAAPVVTNVFPTEQLLVDDVSSFQINKVPQGIPVSTTFAPPIVVKSVSPIVPVFNNTRFGYKGLVQPAFQPSFEQEPVSFSDDEGPVSISADVKASYGDRPSKRVKVDVLLKKDDDEPHITIETDSGKVSRGRFRYRARGGRIRVNGKKNCDDNEDVQNQDYETPNADAFLNANSGNFGSVLSNSEREAFVPEATPGDISISQPARFGGSSRGSGYSRGYQSGVQRGDQRSEDSDYDDISSFGAKNEESKDSRLNKPQLTLGVSVNSPLKSSGIRNNRPHLRGRYRSRNEDAISHTTVSSIEPASYSLDEGNSFISSIPTATPIFSSTLSYPNRGSGIRRKENVEISKIYTGTVADGNAAKLDVDGSPVDLSHAAVIILPCGKLPALLAKLGAVTEGLKSIEKEESNAALKISGKQAGVSLSLPPLNRYGPGGWDTVEKTLGNDACKRAGLFRHPQDCNRFYECFYDEWKGRYSLHEFKCPIRLAYDDSLSACNWPTSGPACSANKLLV